MRWQKKSKFDLYKLRNDRKVHVELASVIPVIPVEPFQIDCAC